MGWWSACSQAGMHAVGQARRQLARQAGSQAGGQARRQAGGQAGKVMQSRMLMQPPRRRLVPTPRRRYWLDGTNPSSSPPYVPGRQPPNVLDPVGTVEGPPLFSGLWTYMYSAALHGAGGEANMWIAGRAIGGDRCQADGPSNFSSCVPAVWYGQVGGAGASLAGGAAPFLAACATLPCDPARHPRAPPLPVGRLRFSPLFFPYISPASQPTPHITAAPPLPQTPSCP